ncbi:DUF4097 family beta strand repeat protein [Acetobacterium paludosum]|uniref:DUF4097 family beta strand repeat protein n=1 Tax=Acetobacterium paludosum TaxID=52693 RepID=A0A923KWX3_9FIRM|nr:DUF4097 family beta strand repeat-containing protein [Acetobacterium paludosum]MBC3888573.1 DUF4097 family beta strand repeat protein [Acetobacterium paludosum]
MKSITRTLLITAGALIGTGFVLAIAGFTIAGFNWQSLSTEKPYEEKTKTFNVSDINALTVDVTSCNVVLVGSDSDEIKIDYFENDDETYDIERSADGNLMVNNESSKKWFNYIHLGINFDTQDRKLTISVPSKYIGSVKAATASGSIEASKLKLSKGLMINSSSGTLKLTDVSVDGAIVADAKSGNIALNSGQIAGNLTILVSSGNLNVVKTKCDGKIAMETNSGNITFKGLAGNDIDLKAASGNISGSIAGNAADYSITAETKNGNKNISNATGGTKHLNASTHSGNINIDFDGSI